MIPLEPNPPWIFCSNQHPRGAGLNPECFSADEWADVQYIVSEGPGLRAKEQSWGWMWGYGQRNW